MQFELTGPEAIFTLGAIERQINKYRAYCTETDAEFGDMNNIHRAAIGHLKSVHAKLVEGLRAEGYPMDGEDIEDMAIDKEPSQLMD